MARIFPTRSQLFLVSAFLIHLAGCATPAKPPLTDLVPGREMETLQSPVALSIKTATRSIGGRGYLIFKRPGRFHVAVLSPFGSTLADIYSDGKQLTCVLTGRQIAYSGLLSELPDRDGLRVWSLMRWVVEPYPAAGPSLTRENVNGSGVRERLFYDVKGLLERKETEEGDRVTYRDYRNVNGVALPESIELGNPKGDRVRIVFDDPVVNEPVEELALQPNLEGINVLPFSSFKGF